MHTPSAMKAQSTLHFLSTFFPGKPQGSAAFTPLLPPPNKLRQLTAHSLLGSQAQAWLKNGPDTTAAPKTMSVPPTGSAWCFPPIALIAFGRLSACSYFIPWTYMSWTGWGACDKYSQGKYRFLSFLPPLHPCTKWCNLLFHHLGQGHDFLRSSLAYTG